MAISSPASPTASERARPGYYSVRLNPVHGAGIDTELTATTRTGMARFTFPPKPALQRADRRRRQRSAGRLRQCPDKPRRARDRRLRLERPLLRSAPPLQGLLRGGLQSPLRCLRHLAAEVFSPGSTAASDSQTPPTNPAATADAGAYATFDTGKNKVVLARVGVSFVSVEDARANLAAENPGLGFGTIASRAQGAWNRSLGRIRVSGGSALHLNTFYTALYHAFVAPRTFNDVNGSYPGMDGLLHKPGAVPSTPTSQAGTSTAPRSSCSRSWRQTGPPTWFARCSPTRPRAAACRAGPTRTGRA